MTTYFIADTHFGHANILKYTDRPWTGVDEMDEDLIDRWNHAVDDDDTVYHLGDFAMGRKANWQPIFDQLNGRKLIVPGNHDPKPAVLEAMGWEVLPPIADIVVRLEDDEAATLGVEARQRFVLCHYPMLTWNRAHRGAVHLHGHSHGGLPQSSTRFDVGVDGPPTWHMGWPHGHPVAAALIADEIATHGHTYEPVDHHRADR